MIGLRYIQIFQPRLDKTAHTESADPRFSKTSLSLSPPHPIQLYALYRYSLVLNRRPASCIWHNLKSPWSSCIEIMFLSKKVSLCCTSKDLRKETNRSEIKRVTKCPTSIFVCAFQFLFYKMTNIGS